MWSMIDPSKHPHALSVTQFYFILCLYYTPLPSKVFIKNFYWVVGIYMNQFSYKAHNFLFLTSKFHSKVNSFHLPEVRYDFYIK